MDMHPLRKKACVQNTFYVSTGSALRRCAQALVLLVLCSVGV